MKLMSTGIIWSFFYKNEQVVAVIVNGDSYRATQPKLYSMFCALFLATTELWYDNIREIQLHTIDKMLKNWTDHLGNCMARRGSHLNEIIFHY